MKIFGILLFSLLLAQGSKAQGRKQRVISDNKKQYAFSDTAGITASYIAYHGDRFPLPDLTTLDSLSITQTYLKGKTVFINCWFVACQPCIAEIPVLNELEKKYKSDSTAFIALTFDKEDRIKSFLSKKPFLFQIAHMPQANIDSLKKISFYPFSVIVNRQGNLSFVLISWPGGKDSGNELLTLLDQQFKKALAQ